GVISGVGVDRVVAQPAGDGVVAAPAIERFRPHAADEDVMAIVAREGGACQAPLERVIVRAAAHVGMAEGGGDFIVAITSAKQVMIGAQEYIAAIIAKDA